MFALLQVSFQDFLPLRSHLQAMLHTPAASAGSHLLSRFVQAPPQIPLGQRWALCRHFGRLTDPEAPAGGTLLTACPEATHLASAGVTQTGTSSLSCMTEVGPLDS